MAGFPICSASRACTCTAANATVTTTVAYSALYQLKLVRNTARLQLTDYRDNDPFPAESHEAALDLAWLAAGKVELKRRATGERTELSPEALLGRLTA